MHFRPRCVVWLYSFICVWKRRYADVRAGTQAPPLRFRLGKIARGTVDVVWVDCVWTVGIVPSLFCPYASAHSPFYAFYFCSVYFFNG